MEFDFRQKLVEEGEIDEAAASRYAEELSRRFAESPEGAALAGHGVVPGHYLGMFLDYGLRYVGVSPAEMDASHIRETLSVMAEKVTARPEDFDRAIPELEGFCDFVGRAFAFQKAAAWKRAIQDYAPEFRRAIRDPRRWGMAKSMLMEGLSRGYDLSTQEGVNRWLHTQQAEQMARIEAERGLAPGEKMSLWKRLARLFGSGGGEEAPDLGEQDTRPPGIAYLTGGRLDSLTPASPAMSKRRWEKEKGKRKQTKASRRKGRR